MERASADISMDIMGGFALEGVLSPEAQLLMQKEHEVPRVIVPDTSLRIKILDACGMACEFCHNEGTPVTADNRNRSAGDFISRGQSTRSSIYLGQNGVDFVSTAVQPDESFSAALDQLSQALPFDEVHLTGGEPSLHPKLPELVRLMVEKGLAVKVTSNGERFYRIAEDLGEAGLSKVVFSIFGTTPEELSAVQSDKYRNARFAEIKLKALDMSIRSAHEAGIAAYANIVMPDESHKGRVTSVLDKYGSICKIRILNSLDEGGESYAAVYELLASLKAEPLKVNMSAGASGMSVDYVLPDGKEVSFKQIRRSYLNEICSTCPLQNNGCEEGFYGVRMYRDTDNDFRVGVCIQRMDLTRKINDFTEGSLPDAINNHRLSDYAALTSEER